MYRYVLRPEGVKGDPGAGYYSPDDVGYYETTEAFTRAPIGLRVTSDNGAAYTVTGS